MRVSRGWSNVDTIIGLVIVGILALIVVPTRTDTGPGPLYGRPPLVSQLQMIRVQIELYNIQNPKTPYDATTPAGPAFWDPLVKTNYMMTAPKNPEQNNSTVVGATPAMGTGWVWAPWDDMVWSDDMSPVYIFRAVDKSGNLYDSDKDGSPD